MYWNQIYLDTFIPELPKHWNYNFASVQRSMDIYYDASQGILIKPLTTTGKVKASKGEFVTAIVDNLVVRNQYTNLYENITTADYSWYSAFIGPDASTRDSSIGESSAYKYLDVNKPYYKIDNLNPIALRCKQVSQIVELLFDPCTDSPNDFKIQLDPCTDTSWYLKSTDASATWISFICIKYDPSYGSTWTRYHFGSDASGVGGGGGGGYVLPTASSTVLGGVKVGPGLKITAGVLTVNDASFVTKNLFDSSINYLTNYFKTYVDGSLSARDTSIAWLNTNKTSKTYVDASLLIRDSLINWLYANMMTSPYVDGSLYARDVSIAWLASNTINFASVKDYIDPSLAARDVSIAWLNNNKISSSYVDNALVSRDTSIAWLNTNKTSKVYVDGSLSLRDVSIAWLAANTINFASVRAYVDPSLASSDTSIAWLNTNKASKIYVDGSLYARDVSIAWLATNALSFQSVKNYIDPSLYLRDVSIAWLNSNKASIIYVDGAIYLRDVSIAWLAANTINFASVRAYVDPSLAARDVSIAWLNTNKPSKTYIDGSLANFIRSSSTGATLKWNAGILDVSTEYYVPPVSDFLDWSTNKYIPYVSKQAKLSFYTGVEDPDDNTRLNLNGYLYASMFGTLSNGTIGINSNQSNYSTPAIKINNDSITEDSSYGVLYTNSLVGTAGTFVTGGSDSPETNNRNSVGHNLLLIRSPYPGGNISYVGNFINIVDDPSTSGDISGKVLSAIIGSSERISFYPRISDSSSSIAYMLDTSNNLSIYGAKLLSLKNQGTEKFYVDASGNAYANGILLGAGGGVIPVANILDWSTNKYIPYSSRQSGVSFYYGTETPSLNTRLNINANLYATNLYSSYIESVTSGTNTNAIGGIALQTGGVGIYGTASGIGGVGIEGQSELGFAGIFMQTSVSSSSNVSSNVFEIRREPVLSTGNMTGDLLYISDNPDTTGTISGSSIKVSIGNITRINFNPRVADTSSSIAYILDTSSALSTYGAKLLSLKNQGTEKFYVDASGNTYANGVLLGAGISNETLFDVPHYYRQVSGIDSSGDIRMYVNGTGKYTQQYNGSTWVNKETILW